MAGYETRNLTKDKAVMVALINREQPEEDCRYLDELAFLAQTLDLNVVKSFTQDLINQTYALL